MPQRETSEDRGREAEIIKKTCEAWNCQAVEFPEFSAVDYVLHREGIATVGVEVKTTPRAIGDYPTFIVDKDKLIKATEFAKLQNLRIIIINKWVDFVGWCEITQEKVCKEFEAAREDRPNEVKPLALIETKHFKEVYKL